MVRRTDLQHAPVAQSVEHIHGKDGVTGSSPVGGCSKFLTKSVDRPEGSEYHQGWVGVYPRE